MKKKRQQATPPLQAAHQTCDDATPMFLSEMFSGISASRLKFYKYPITTSKNIYTVEKNSICSYQHMHFIAKRRQLLWQHLFGGFAPVSCRNPLNSLR